MTLYALQVMLGGQVKDRMFIDPLNKQLYFTYSSTVKIDKQLSDKSNDSNFVPSEDPDQPGHPPCLIRVFPVCSLGNQWSKIS